MVGLNRKSEVVPKGGTPRFLPSTVPIVVVLIQTGPRPLVHIQNVFFLLRDFNDNARVAGASICLFQR